jgi:hypothetical protein
MQNLKMIYSDDLFAIAPFSFDHLPSKIVTANSKANDNQYFSANEVLSLLRGFPFS